MNPAIHILDVAHPPRPADVVEQELLEAFGCVRNSTTLRAIKVVHGYGSTGKGGVTRETVRNWAFRQRQRVRAVIEGERYAALEGSTETMIREIGPLCDADLGTGNPGITILWVR